MVGEVRAEVADELGLPAGVKVLGGVNDNHAVALGTGALEEGRAGVSMGTTANISALVDGLKTDLARRLSAMPSPLPGRNMVMAENGMGGKVLELALRQIFFPHAEDGLDGRFAALERTATAIPPGAGGLLFLPWINGAGSPGQDARARAGFLNISVDTTHGHMMKSVLEGLAFNLRWLNDAVENFVETRHPFRKTFEQLTIGDTLITKSREVTLDDIEHFAAFTGDNFYAHMDEEAAAKNPFFDGRVAHGYLIVSFAAGLFVDPDFGPVLANYGLDELRFAQPVNYGDVLQVRLTCKQKTLRADKGYGEVRWDTEVTNQDNDIVAQYDVLTMVATDEHWASVSA